MTAMRLAKLLLPMVALGGCAANVPQWQQLRSLLPLSAAQRQAADYGWKLRFNGTEFIVFPLQAQGRRVLRHTRNGGNPRGLFCAMGVCFDCDDP